MLQAVTCCKMATVTVALKDADEGEWYSFLLSPEEESRLSQDPEFASLLLSSAKKNKTTSTNAAVPGELHTNELHTTSEEETPAATSSQELDIISEVQDESEEKFTWNYQSVQALLTLFRLHKDKFESPEMKKKNVWKEISTKMQEQGYIISAEHCDKKWRNLRSTYKTVLCKKSRRPLYKKTWEFFNEMHEICQDEVIVPERLPSTSVPANPTNTISTVPNANGTLPVIQILQGHSGSILQRSLQMQEPKASSKKRKIDLAEPTATTSSGADVFLLPETQNTIEPEWFLHYKQEVKVENEKNIQEIKKMHNENIKLLKDRNEILKSLVQILSKDCGEDMSVSEKDLGGSPMGISQSLEN